MKRKPAKGTVKRLLKMLFGYFPKLLPVIICLIIINAVISALPSVFQQKVVAVLQNSWEQGISWEETRPEIMKNVRTLVIFYGCSLAAGFAYNQLMAVFTQGTLAKLRDEMFSHMETLPIRYFDTNKRGDVMSYYTNDVDAMRQMISQSFPQLLVSAISVTTILCIMMYYSVWMGLVIVLGSFVTFEETEHYDVFPGDQTWLHSRLVYVSNNPDAPDVVTFDDLAGSEIVIPDVIQQMIDYKFSDYNDTTPGLQITYVTKDPSQLGMIMTEIRNGDYDDAIVFPSLLNPYLTDLSEYKISPVPELDKDMCSPMGWVYLKEHKELARRVAEELKQMMKNGELSDLSRAYFGIDLTVPTEPEFLDYYYQVYPDMK